MKAVITGGGGQVATALLRLKPPGVDATIFSHVELDIGDSPAVERALAALKPDVLINAAAYTAVDKAESEPGLAQRVNAEGAGHLAMAARKHGVRFLHISTDFVFDGEQSHPYAPDAMPRPLCVYGVSKLEGERRVLAALEGKALILRTAWVYAGMGRNFVLTMLRLMREKGQVRVVADQVGSPTWSVSLAEALWAAAAVPGLAGVHHWTDAGAASWYDFAVAIAEEAGALDMLPRNMQVTPICTADYPTPARRPAYSMLDRSSTEQALRIKAAHWRVNLRKMLQELHHA
ncbi:MAG TPA: dTDP-4-dehydrorhamnose reductase [Gammaproteobacteria bacterium]|jgi:dTDP-4-dehydrorhamnose reductase|nr:dTDP-4-dehydrorhamnose reductase [Gammaproteobacteria bacterium]